MIFMPRPEARGYVPYATVRDLDRSPSMQAMSRIEERGEGGSDPGKAPLRNPRGAPIS